MPNADIFNFTDTWNNAGTTFDAIKVNVTDTASQSASAVLRLQVASSDVFTVRKDGAVTVGSWAATAIGATVGGTGQTSWTTGDILYASASNTLSKLAAGTDGHVLTLASGVPTWAAASGGASAPLTLASGTLTDPSAALTITQTWNDAADTFNSLVINVTDTNSASASNLIQANVGGVAKFAVRKTGEMYFVNVNGTGTTAIKAFGNDLLFCDNNQVRHTRFTTNTANTVQLEAIGAFGWVSAGSAANNADTSMWRDAAGTVALRNSTTAHALRVYGTHTDATNYQRMSIASASQTLSGVTGASVTATALIPDGAFLVGLTTRVTTALGTGNGTSGYQIGDGSDTDRWGTVTGTAIGTTTDNRDFTVTTAQFFNADQNVVITANGGNFDGTGVIQVIAYYIRGEAD